jgi:HSP20 family protein
MNMATETKQQVPVSVQERETTPALGGMAEVERLLERMLGRSWPTLEWWKMPAWDGLFKSMELRMPSVDVVDRNDDVLVRVEVPGMDKNDLDISLTDNVLSVKGKVREEKEEKGGEYYRREISGTAFARSVGLPVAVVAAKTTAVLKDGILEVVLPKVEASKRRSIAVQ